MAESEKMAVAIHNGLAENPVQWGAFLIGLQSGYTLAKSAQQPAEASQEKNN